MGTVFAQFFCVKKGILFIFWTVWVQYQRQNFIQKRHVHVCINLHIYSYFLGKRVDFHQVRKTSWVETF